MYQVGICGHFATNKNFADGQTVKTKIFRNELAKVIGQEEILIVDTYNWRKKPIKLLMECFRLIKKCDNVVIMPAHKGLKVLLPLFALMNTIFKKKIHYVVIGGWLPNYLKENNYLIKYAKKLNSIHVETYSMIEGLKKLGITNVYYMPNFKSLKVLSKNELIYPDSIPYKLCTFSRVVKEKGIEDAIDAVNKINKKHNTIAYCLDIYGPIDESYKQRFSRILENTDEFISYKGVVQYDKSVDTIKNYFALIFPTYYQGEGFAGTLLDSLASGVPIIASNWRYNSEIVKDGIVGLVYDINRKEGLEQQLEKALNNPQVILDMKTECLEYYKKYEPSNVINNFMKIVNR